MAMAFTFPGQGSQHAGMGKALADEFSSARDVFATVDEALGQNLSTLMFDGPEDELVLTENAQPALMAVSMAVVAVLKNQFGIDVQRVAGFVAGHSLGEYSALAAAGGVSIADAARLLKVRGQAMQAAVPVGAGAMAALLGLDFSAAADIAAQAAQNEVCEAANDNAPGQVVISGDRRAVERALDIAKTRGARRAVLLPVSAPFHCSLMAPAAAVMAEALNDVDMCAPCVPLIANVTAGPLHQPGDIRDSLVRQVTGTVRWRDSVGYMAGQGVGLFCELGAGKVLTGMVRRNAEGARGIAAGTPDGIAALAELITSKEDAHV